MANVARGVYARLVRDLWGLGSAGDRPDASLLDAYASRGEGAEAAFAALVERHGPMVLRACRGVLREHHDADDAFQATFLVLAARASSLRREGSVGPWLHAVAVRVASRALAKSALRRRREREAVALTVRSETCEALDDLASDLHREIDGLPERYRGVVVLCDLEGLTYAQAADRIGRPIGTVQSRLARGRRLLRERLTRRGLSGPTSPARAIVPPGLSEGAVRAALRVSSGGWGSAASAALAKGELKMMLLHRASRAATVLLATAAGIAGLVGLTRAELPRPEDPPSKVAEAEEVPMFRTLAHGEQILGVAFSPDGLSLASAGYGNGSRVKVWSTRTGALRHSLEGAYRGWRSVAFSPDGLRLAAGGGGTRPENKAGDNLRLWEAGTGRPGWTAEKDDLGVEWFALDFSPDGRTLAVGGRSMGLSGGFGAKIGVLRLLDARTGAVIRELSGGQTLARIDDVWAVRFSPDGRTLAAGTNTSSEVVLYDTATWASKATIGVTRVTSLAFSPDGRTLAVGQMGGPSGRGGEVSLLGVGWNARPRSLAGQDQIILSVAISPDGLSLATGGYDKTARIYDLKSGTLVRRRATTAWANSVAFSPDGRFLAIGGSPDVHLWEWKADVPPEDGAARMF